MRARKGKLGLRGSNPHNDPFIGDQSAKSTLKASIADQKSRLDEIGRMYEALRLPLMSVEPASNASQLLGAYQLEARCSLSAAGARSAYAPRIPEIWRC